MLRKPISGTDFWGERKNAFLKKGDITLCGKPEGLFQCIGNFKPECLFFYIKFGPPMIGKLQESGFHLDDFERIIFELSNKF